MITNVGKGILAKYLLGQAPAYASYIAVGCGPAALNNEDPGFTSLQKEQFSEKTSLDFEMFRVPIISKGFVNEDNLVKIVLTAELPTEERYEITEVGIFSAGANPSAGAIDSRTIYSFSQSEGWEYRTSGNSITIPSILTPLEEDENTESIITVANPVFFTNADNRTFIQSQERTLRNERCRFLNSMLVISGSSSELTRNSNGVLSPNDGDNHVRLTDASVNLNRHAPSDELKVAFSVINKNGEVDEHPDNVKVLIQFASSDSSDGEYASLSIDLDDLSFDGDGDSSVDFSTNRYVVSTKQLQDLFYTAGFSWDLVSIVKVYASVLKDDEPSSDFYVCLDGIRIENTSINNPLYGLTGYSVIKNNDALPIVKLPNTSNFIEFRLAIGVQ